MLSLSLCTTSYGQNAKLVDFIAPQQDSAFMKQRFWIDLGGGININPVGGPALVGNSNLHYLNKNRRHLQVRGVYFVDMVMFAPAKYEYTEFAWLSGWMKRNGTWVKEFSTGLSYSYGFTRTSNASMAHQFKTVGIPVELDIKRLDQMPMGLGFNIKGNLNLNLPYIMGGVEFTIGSPVRNRKTQRI